MIKLERGERPKELTDEVCEELKKLYAEDRDKDVWNSTKIKKPLKEAMLDMSHGKCSYCESRLEIESKDATIDHFLPKSKNPDEVVNWENLFPSCLRCNRKKNDNEDRLVNPCLDKPADYIGLAKKNPFRLVGIDDEKIGKNTITAIGLNDIVRVMGIRMEQWENIYQHMEEIYEDLQEVGYQKKYKTRFERLMGKCTAGNDYAAVKATNMLNDDIYKSIKQILVSEGVWTSNLQEMENEIQDISLKMV